MGFLARAGSEARPGSERRPVPSTGQNTVLPAAHSGLRPPFTTEERIRFDRS